MDIKQANLAKDGVDCVASVHGLISKVQNDGLTTKPTFIHSLSNYREKFLILL